jgi:hypothetical protein
MMSVEQSVEWELVGKTEVLWEKLPQYHFVHHKSHITWPLLEPGPPLWKPATNFLSYDTAFHQGLGNMLYTESVPGRKVNILGDHSIVVLSKILHTVANTGIYRSSDKGGKVYLI